MRSTTQHAWFSAKAQEYYGSWQMTSVDGTSVRICMLSKRLLHGRSFFWEDAVYVGKVIDWSHRNRIYGCFERKNEIQSW